LPLWLSNPNKNIQKTHRNKIDMTKNQLKLEILCVNAKGEYCLFYLRFNKHTYKWLTRQQPHQITSNNDSDQLRFKGRVSLKTAHWFITISAFLGQSPSFQVPHPII
jgi:hypothetical protein